MPVSYVAPGYHTITPYITVRGAGKALEFYKQAFGATEVMRFEMPGGIIGHAEIEVGGSKVMLADECPEWGNRGPQSLGGTSGGLCIYVPDADAAIARAVAAGATVLKPVMDQFYGDRSGTVTDPFGHVWTFATHIEDVSVEELQRRFAAFATQAA
jgi:PhnB protein